jgi:N-acetylneuraminic acid mutarotase
MARTLARNTLRILICLTIATHALAAWEEREPLPTGSLTSFGIAALNEKVYVFGGISDVGFPTALFEYDPVDDSWQRKADMLVPGHSMGVATLGGEIYAVGMTNGAAVHAYDPATDTWRQRARLSLPRYGLECVTIAGKLYAIGGRPAGDPAPVDVYDPANNSWTPRRSAPHRLRAFGAAVVNDRILVTGGARLPGDPPSARGIASTLVYDPVLDDWAYLADMPTAREGHATVAVGGAVYAIGGWNQTGVLTRVDKYDVATNQWGPVDELPSPLQGHGAVAVDGQVFVFGGWRFEGRAAEVLVWDAGTVDVSSAGKRATTWGALRSLALPD